MKFMYEYFCQVVFTFDYFCSKKESHIISVT